MSTFPQYSQRSIYRHMVKVHADVKELIKITKKKENSTRNTSKNVNSLAKRKTYRNIPIEISMHLRFLHQDLGMNGKDISRKYQKYKKTPIYRHMKMYIKETDIDARTHSPGRIKNEKSSFLIIFPNWGIILYTLHTGYPQVTN